MTNSCKTKSKTLANSKKSVSFAENFAISCGTIVHNIATKTLYKWI